MRIATYNVLKTEPCVECILSSNQRYKHTIESLLPGLNADIICLNEVTVPFYEKLIKDQYLMDIYKISHFEPKSKVSLNSIILSKFGIQVLHQTSRIQIAVVYRDQNSGYVEMDQFGEDKDTGEKGTSEGTSEGGQNIGESKGEFVSFIVVAAHLRAQENNYLSRQEELKQIFNYISAEYGICRGKI